MLDRTPPCATPLKCEQVPRQVYVMQGRALFKAPRREVGSSVVVCCVMKGIELGMAGHTASFFVLLPSTIISSTISALFLSDQHSQSRRPTSRRTSVLKERSMASTVLLFPISFNKMSRPVKFSPSAVSLQYARSRREMHAECWTKLANTRHPSTPRLLPLRSSVARLTACNGWDSASSERNPRLLWRARNAICRK